MTKLYHDKGAWVIPGNQEKGAERVDVPNAPQDLADWLNCRGVPPIAVPCPPTAAEPSPVPPPSGPTVPDERKQRAAELLAIGRDVDAISAWILEQPGWAIENLFAALGARVAALRT